MSYCFPLTHTDRNVIRCAFSCYIMMCSLPLFPIPTPPLINTIPISALAPVPKPCPNHININLMSTSLLNIFQTTINTRDRLPPTITNFNVFQGMSQRAAASITHGHISLDFDWWNFFDEFEGVGTVLAQFVVNIDEGQPGKIKFATRRENN
jgi:hypothetical protein